MRAKNIKVRKLQHFKISARMSDHPSLCPKHKNWLCSGTELGELELGKVKAAEFAWCQNSMFPGTFCVSGAPG